MCCVRCHNLIKMTKLRLLKRHPNAKMSYYNKCSLVQEYQSQLHAGYIQTVIDMSDFIDHWVDNYVVYDDDITYSDSE